MLVLIFPGTESYNAFKLGVEMREVIETRFETYLGDAEFLVNQQFTGMTYLDFVEKLNVGFVGPGFKVSAKRSSTHIGDCRDFIETGIPVVVVHDELVNAVHAHAVVVIGIFGKGVTGKIGEVFRIGHDFQDGQQIDDIVYAVFVVIQFEDVAFQLFLHRITEFDPLSRLAQKLFDGDHLGKFPKIFTQKIFLEIYYLGAGAQAGILIVIGRIAAVEMGDVGPVKNQVAFFKSFHTVTYKTDSRTFQHQHDLVLRVEMPGREKVGLIHVQNLIGPVFLRVDNL